MNVFFKQNKYLSHINSSAVYLLIVLNSALELKQECKPCVYFRVEMVNQKWHDWIIIFIIIK